MGSAEGFRPRAKLDVRDDLVGLEGVSGGDVDGLDDSVGGGGDGLLHLHGLDDQDLVALLHGLSDCRYDADDLAGERGGDGGAGAVAAAAAGAAAAAPKETL